MITKNKKLGGYDIVCPNGALIWIAGSLADAKQELKNESKKTL